MGGDIYYVLWQLNHTAYSSLPLQLLCHLRLQDVMCLSATVEDKGHTSSMKISSIICVKWSTQLVMCYMK